jgi:hypothetical protein
MQASPHPTAIAPPRHLDADGPHACVDVARGALPVPDEGLPPWDIPALALWGSPHRNVHLKRLGQEPLGSPT